MFEGFSPIDELPPPPKRWRVTKKIRAWLIRIKDCLIYQSGMHRNAHYSFDGSQFADGTLGRASESMKWSRRWDAFLERWQYL